MTALEKNVAKMLAEHRRLEMRVEKLASELALYKERTNQIVELFDAIGKSLDTIPYHVA